MCPLVMKGAKATRTIWTRVKESDSLKKTGPQFLDWGDDFRNAKQKPVIYLIWLITWPSGHPFSHGIHAYLGSSTYLSMHPPFLLCIQLLITYLVIYTSIYLYIHLLIHYLSIHLSLYSHLWIHICPSTHHHLFFYCSSNYPSTIHSYNRHPSVHLFIHLPDYPFTIYSSVHIFMDLHSFLSTHSPTHSENQLVTTPHFTIQRN